MVVDVQASPRAAILSDAPILYYAFEETSGTVAVDSSGNGNDGTYVDATLGTPGISGSGVNFPVGEGSYVSVPDLGVCLEDWTVEMYVAGFDGFGTISDCCVSLYSTDACGDGGCAHMNYVYTENGTEFAGGPAGFVFTDAGLSAPAEFTEPVHIAFVVSQSAGTAVVYINGVDVTTEGVAEGGCLNLTVGRIASWVQEGGRFFEGTIDDFAIFSTALSQERIQAHFSELGPPAIVVDQSATQSIPEAHPVIPVSTTFTVVLDGGDPNAGIVTVTLDPNDSDGNFSELDIDLGSGTATPITLTFNTSNWDDPQTVTVTAFDDGLSESCTEVAGITILSTIDDPNQNSAYIGARTRAQVTVIDNETGCVIVDIGDGVNIDELDPNGTIDTLTYVLNRAPSGTDNVVTLEETSGLSTVTPLVLTFNLGNWATPQTVTVKANQDEDFVGDDPVITASSSGDSDPEAFNPVASVNVALAEDECGELFFDINDYNEDCVVNLLDFSLFSSGWGSCTQPDPANCP